MLKIKQNVDLKELEKYGFIKQHWGYIYYPNNNNPNTRYFSSIKIEVSNRIIMFDLENMNIWCNSIEELESDFENIKQSYEAFKVKCDDLIQAGLVEKMGRI